ncbi:hypothetical protein [Pontibacter ruber]|uniref:Phage protein n=1 Tax=Pontibacter ruber TaxID=1343895 RepID=A0ABW5CZA6_9BACT|nr:hypothetical protein [Pontibacter ruber]
MVTIVDWKKRNSEDGREFNALILQGELELIQSKETGRFYATAKKASISCTFNDVVCATLIGKTLPGQIEKMECDPYEYTIPDSGEVIILSHTYYYDPVPRTMEQSVFGVRAA